MKLKVSTATGTTNDFINALNGQIRQIEEAPITSAEIDELNRLVYEEDPVYEDDLIKSIEIGIANIMSESGLPFNDAIAQVKQYYINQVDQVADSMEERYF